MNRGALIFGMVDGLTLVLGLLAGAIVFGQGTGAIWHDALSGGVAELGGMSLGQYWADEQEGRADVKAAAANGVGGFCACIMVGVPYLALSRTPAAIVSLCIVAALGAFICWLRPERGVKAVVRTYGLLILVGAISAGSGYV